MKRLRNLIIAVILLLAAGVTQSAAQCKFRNTAFKSGEYLSYNLYFNWKFVWVKVGNASMSTVESKYHGKPAYRSSLITRSSANADKFFVMRDTLLCYNSLQMEPLYFRKGAREGDRYTVDEAFFSYPGGKTHLKQHQQKNNGTHVWHESKPTECTSRHAEHLPQSTLVQSRRMEEGQPHPFPHHRRHKGYTCRARI